ncbi:MAG: sialidase family protein [Sporolactobacillus sp.]|uniref:sialidase family protein n=1 Tax=Sporolactobacillus sp. STSJ-5 TaxID=2965076 RepID=UPI002106033F|nr:sialidase family protein [Sporolactobacillus sp. STSJ-5]MCQ2009335.1 glycoside hydrolase [Sporolactobacillus sp. STSJ-5]
MKKKNEASGTKSVSWVFWLLIAKIIFILLLAGLTVWIIYAVHASNSTGGVRFTHVLGAGYSKDGKTLWLGTNKRLLTYKKGIWHSEKLKNRAHDDMFLAISSGFIQMNETGYLQWKTLKQEPLGHRKLNEPLGGLWAFGYKTGRMYHLQTIAGEGSALRYSDDGGATWKVVKIKHLDANAQILEASPVDKRVLAIGTTRGLYVSTDLGAHFHRYLKGYSVTSAAFGFSKQNALLVAVAGKETALYQIIPQQEKSINLDMGTVENDTVTQILQNPANSGEAVMMTKHGDLYRTENSGQNWTIIAKKGRGLNGN